MEVLILHQSATSLPIPNGPMIVKLGDGKKRGDLSVSGATKSEH